MVAFVQTQKIIWLLARTAEGLQKLLQTYGLCTCCPSVMPPEVPWWLTFYFPCCLSSIWSPPRETISKSKSNRRNFRIVMGFLGPLAMLLLCTSAYFSLSSPCLPSCSPSTGGGSQLCLHFALLSSTTHLLKNPMQEYSPFNYSLAPSLIHQTWAYYQRTTWSQAPFPYTPPWKPCYRSIILEMSAITATPGQIWAEGKLNDLEIWVKDRKAKEYLQQEQTPQVQRNTLDRYLTWRVIDAEHHFASLESPKD